MSTKPISNANNDSRTAAALRPPVLNERLNVFVSDVDKALASLKALGNEATPGQIDAVDTLCLVEYDSFKLALKEANAEKGVTVETKAGIRELTTELANARNKLAQKAQSMLDRHKAKQANWTRRFTKQTKDGKTAVTRVQGQCMSIRFTV